MNISNVLIQVDNVCDYIPVVSSVTNLVVIFQKYVVMPNLKESNIVNNHYFIHLQNKNTVRCVVLLLPVLGNIFVAIYVLFFRLEE